MSYEFLGNGLTVLPNSSSVESSPTISISAFMALPFSAIGITASAMT